PISLEEITKAIANLPAHKSPCPGGLSIRYYKEFSQILSPHLLSLYNHSIHRRAQPAEMLMAHISTLPKPGKPQNLRKNFRPFSLLNADAKLYAKQFSNQLAPILRKLVHNDKSGFIKGHQGSDNTWKILNVLAMERGSV
ncbi:Hypothetical predicted protein, partial [Pelobates cultripes]